jgi:UTP--glucose-1-phosphate uridylyltransferase
MKKVTKAIITDAGFASRFLPICKTIPKAMIPMGAKPIMQLCVEECVAAGIEEIVIVATPGTKGKEIYEDYFHGSADHVHKLLNKHGRDDRFGPVREVLGFPKITIIEQDSDLPYGNGSPIVSARKFVEDEEAFVVLYSDDIIIGEQGDVATLIEFYQKNPEAKAVIAAKELPESEWHRYGMIALKDEEKRTLSHIVEKPKTSDLAPSSLTSYGRYLLTPEIFKYLTTDNTGLDNELWTVDAITKLAKAGDVLVVTSQGEWLTTGDPKNYFLAQLEYALVNKPDWVEDIKRVGHGHH